MKPYIAFAALMALAPPLAAQHVLKPDPLDPAAAVPPVKYESAFTRYAPFREQSVAPWRDVNDEVARAGGHAGIFREHGTHAPAKSAKPPVPGAAVKPDSAPSPKAAGKPPAQGYDSQH